MRTTLTLEPDIAALLKEKMREQSATLKDVVNQALRRGLAAEPAKSIKPYTVRAHDFGMAPGIDLNRLNQLSDELETERFLRGMKS